jgi:hypothetical protein
MRKIPDEDYKLRISGDVDPNQNTVANVNLGLSNYSYLANMKKIASLLKSRKKNTIKLKKTTNEK